MTIALRVRCEGDCLSLRVPDGVQAGQAYELIESLREAMAAHPAPRVAVDVRPMVGILTVTARYQAGERVAARLPHDRAIAFIATEEHVLPDRFMEVVAKNRGAHILVTTSPAEAAAWLGVPVELVELPS